MTKRKHKKTNLKNYQGREKTSKSLQKDWEITKNKNTNIYLCKQRETQQDEILIEQNLIRVSLFNRFSQLVPIKLINKLIPSNVQLNYSSQVPDYTKV